MNIRKAKSSDIESAFQLINFYADKGLLLPRTRASLFENIQSLYILEMKEQIIAAAGLHVLGKNLAEIRSLVVNPEVSGRGIGRKIVEKLIEETRVLEIEKLISLTYQINFFEKCGFSVIQKERLPQKVWRDCINCPKFLNCDEIAMIRYLS